MLPKQRPGTFVLSSSNHGPVIVSRNDYCLTSPNSGFGVGYQVLNLSAYDLTLTSNLQMLVECRRSLFGDGVVVVDCGANIGIFTIELARLMQGWGSIIAIEAQEPIFYALAGNIALNNCFNARAIFAAVGNKVDMISVPVLDYFTPSSFGSLELKKGDRNEFIGQNIDYLEEHCAKIKMMTIDSMNLRRLDLIKIDVEGMEFDVLEGAQQTIAMHKPQIVIEKCKVDESKLRHWLFERDYYVYSDESNFTAIHRSDDTCNKLMILGR